MRIEIREKQLFKDLIKQNFDIEMNVNKINSICTDSRIIEKNDIFIPIKGKNTDGHKFIDDAIAKDASIIFSEKLFDNNRVINVNSTKKALKDLSTQWINFFKKPIIAITGSNGKTTTKEMVRKIFDSISQTNHTIGNYNSSVGLPINLFGFSLSSEPIILEMGANSPGEIDYLCKIAKPDYSIITNIQNAHIGNFQSIQDLIETKTSIFKNTNTNGLIFENSDDIYLSNACKNFPNKIQFGFNNRKVDFFGSIKIINNKVNFHINGKEIKNSNINEIMAKNMLAAYSIAYTYGIDHKNIKDVFKNFNFLKGRGNHIYNKGYLIIDDTYNANFDSFKIGINSFLDIKCKGRKFLVIGDMKELGTETVSYHSKLGDFINNKKIDFVCGIGKNIHNTINTINNSQIYSKEFSDNKELVLFLKNQLKKDDAIYLKASRSMHFENIIEKL
ncbi:MAG: hypothetical protein CMG21_02875 [Candidatus Marinimicrobia bacterium]|nr:hypothetical protein [Candidatus Neomarinimicrobiota bacterium]